MKAGGIVRLLSLVTGLVVLSGGMAQAQVTDTEGSATSGSNNTLATAQNAGTYTPGQVIAINGWVDSTNTNDVDFYRFTLTAPTVVYLDIDYAEDVGVASDLDVGLDPAIAVFDSTGTLVADNDDSDFFGIGPLNQHTDPGSDPWADHDSFVGALSLPAGTYYVAVAYYDNDPNAFSQIYSTTSLSYSGESVSGATPDATYANSATCSNPADPAQQCVGAYQLNIRDFFSEAFPVPALSPAGLLALVLGVAVAGLLGLRRTVV